MRRFGAVDSYARWLFAALGVAVPACGGRGSSRRATGPPLAAVEAEHGAEHAADPALRAALSGIARDETRHAALAWRFVGWLLDTQPELRVFARNELAAAAAEVRAGALPPAVVGSERKRELGLLDERERAELRRDALARVVIPCADVLLGSARALAA